MLYKYVYRGYRNRTAKKTVQRLVLKSGKRDGKKVRYYIATVSTTSAGQTRRKE